MTDYMQRQYQSEAIDNDGYARFREPGHPLADKSGYVRLSRHVASQNIGRWLTSDEVVQFEDGNKGNCSPDNLTITTRAEVARHARLFAQTSAKVHRICANPACRQPFSVSASQADRRFHSDECAQKARRKFDVAPAEMAKMVWEMPTSKIGEMFGVTDKAIEKFCKKHNIPKPPRGYWAKLYAGQRDIAADDKGR